MVYNRLKPNINAVIIALNVKTTIVYTSTIFPHFNEISIMKKAVSFYKLLIF